MFKDFIPEDEGAALEQALAVNNDSLVVVYKRNVCDAQILFSLSL